MIEHLGRWLILVGIAIAVFGGILMLAGRLAPAGRLLPGDIVVRRPGFTLYLPLATCALASVVLTMAIWLVSLLRR